MEQPPVAIGCNRDLLPGRSPRIRYLGTVAALTSGILFAFLFLAIDRLPFAQVGSALAAPAFAASLPVAVMPVSMANRYRRRARDLMLRDPDQAMP